MVESQPSKLLVAGSIPVSRSSLCELKQESSGRALFSAGRVGWIQMNGVTAAFVGPLAVCKTVRLVTRPDAEQPYLHHPAMASVPVGAICGPM